MSKIKVVIVGMRDEGASVYRVLRRMENVEIMGVGDLSPSVPGMMEARMDKVFISVDLEELLADPGIQVIIDTTGIKNKIHELKQPTATVMEALPGNLLMSIIQAKEELLEVKKLKSELWAILNSVQDAIEMADNTGLIKYVNPAFTRVTGIQRDDRVGKNIFEVSPHGALAQVLVKQKPIVGYRSKVGGSGVDVISNASTVMVEGEIVGAVVVFQPITDILKLMDDLQQSTTIIENLYAKIDQITGSRFTFEDLTGNSKVFLAVVEAARKAAKSNSPVLLVGESGTGKDIIAHALHQASIRRGKPFIKVSCASIPEELLESELFGHEKGAFTGAVKTKLGRVELACGGTLFLDEINEMNSYMQGKMLRLLKTCEFDRVGGSKTLKANVRIIAASNVDLRPQARKNSFNEGLLNRFTVELKLPPLRQRCEDIPLIVDHLINKFNRKLDKSIKSVSPEAMHMLVKYDWPANIRELENVIERAMVAADNEMIGTEHLSPCISQFTGTAASYFKEIMPLDKMEQLMLKAALLNYGESLEGKKKAAQALNISLATLYNKLKKYRNNM